MISSGYPPHYEDKFKRLEALKGDTKYQSEIP